MGYKSFVVHLLDQDVKLINEVGKFDPKVGWIHILDRNKNY